MSKRSRRRKKAISKKKQLKGVKDHQTNSTQTIFETYLNNGEYEKVIKFLEEKYLESPDEETRRQLYKYYSQVEKYQKAIDLVNALTEPNRFDLLFAGWCYILLKEWNNSIHYIRQSLSISETPEALYWLSIALGEDEPTYKLEDSQKEEIRNTLWKAIKLPDCREEAFLRLGDFYGWVDTDVLTRIEILQLGIQTQPKSNKLRHALARLLIHHKNEPKKALELLRPALEEDTPPVGICFLAFEAAGKAELYELALTYLELAAYEYDPAWSRGIDKLLGDTHAELTNYDKAFAHYEKEKTASIVRINNLTETYNDSQNASMLDKWQIRHNIREEYHLQALINLKIADIEFRLMKTQGGISSFVEGGLLCLDQILNLFGTIGPSIIVNEYTLSDGDSSRLNIESLCFQVLDTNDSSITDLSIAKGLAYFLLWLAYDTEDGYRDDFIKDPVRENYLLQSLELVQHPGISKFAVNRLINEGDLAHAIEHHFNYEIWFAKYHSSEENYHFSAQFGKNKEEIYEKIPKSKRIKLHKLIYARFLEFQKDEHIITYVFVPFYKSFWRKLLFAGNMFKEVVEISNVFTMYLNSDTDSWFDLAFSQAQIGEKSAAIRSYQVLLSVNNNSPGALHNLSILMESTGDHAKALELSQQAAQIAEKDQLIQQRYTRLQEQLREREQELRRQEDFLRTATERWPQVDYYKRQLLSALIVISGFESWEHLSQLSGIGVQYLPGHWRKLVELGMIVGDNNKWYVNDHILDLVRREKSHSIVTKLIHADETIAFKPIFNSKLEYMVYSILVGLFPNQLVFPNIGLQAIFQYSRMKEILSQEHFQYYLMAQADFCITSTANYLPIIAFEVDSYYHDTLEQQVRDERKNDIFRLGGVPLLRLMPVGRPNEQIIRQQIIESVQMLGEQLRSTQSRGSKAVNLSLEIDYAHFGTGFKQEINLIEP